MATPRSPYTRNSYDGGATQASLSAAIDSSTTTITLANTSNSWDSLGASYGFFMSLDYGGQYEEKVYVPAQSITWTSTTVTLINVVRGVDGTSPQSHVAAAVVVVVMTATDLDEANYAVTQTVGKVTTQGDMLYASSANALARLAPGTAGQLLQTNGSGAAPTWLASGSAGQMLTSQGSGSSPTWVDASNVWTTNPATVSGFANYLIIADVTLTQPSTGAAAGAITLTAGSKSVTQSYPATNTWVETVSLVGITSSPGTITASASKNSTGTLGTVNLIVIGLN